MLFNKAGLLAIVALSTSALAQWEDYSDIDLYSREADLDYDAYLQGYLSGLSRRQDKAAADQAKTDVSKLTDAKGANEQAKKDAKVMSKDTTKLAANQKKLDAIKLQISSLNEEEEKNKDDKTKLEATRTKLKALYEDKKKLKDEKAQLQKDYKGAATDQKAQMARVQKDLARRALLEEYFDWDY